MGNFSTIFYQFTQPKILSGIHKIGFQSLLTKELIIFFKIKYLKGMSIVLFHYKNN